jgi:hypothetical protein
MSKKILLGMFLAFNAISALAGEIVSSEEVKIGDTAKKSLVVVLNSSEMADAKNVKFEIAKDDSQVLIVTHPDMNQSLFINLADNNAIFDDASNAGFKVVKFTNGKDYNYSYKIKD